MGSSRNMLQRSQVDTSPRFLGLKRTRGRFDVRVGETEVPIRIEICLGWPGTGAVRSPKGMERGQQKSTGRGRSAAGQ